LDSSVKRLPSRSIIKDQSTNQSAQRGILAGGSPFELRETNHKLRNTLTQKKEKES
jgi:hypothetical protein